MEAREPLLNTHVVQPSLRMVNLEFVGQRRRHSQNGDPPCVEYIQLNNYLRFVGLYLV